MPVQQNPSEFGPHWSSASCRGVLFALAAAKAWLGDRGLDAVAGLSGLTEMDAITLSTARLSITDAMIATDGWRLIVLAVMANIFSKAVLAGILGGWRFGLRLVLNLRSPWPAVRCCWPTFSTRYHSTLVNPGMAIGYRPWARARPAACEVDRGIGPGPCAAPAWRPGPGPR